MKSATFAVILTGVLTFLGCALNQVNPETLPSNTERALDEKIRKKVISFVRSANLYGVVEDSIEDQFKILSIGIEEPTYERIAVCRVGKVRIHVQVKDLRIVLIYNKYLEDDMLSGALTEEESENNYDEMVKIARQMIEKHFGEIPRNMLLESPEDRNEEPFFGDIWTITWRRHTGGYIYRQNVIGSFFSEKHGILNFRNSVSSNEVDTKVKLSKEEAIVKAREYLPIAIKQYNKHEAKLPMCKEANVDYEPDSVDIPEIFGLDMKRDRPCIVNIGHIEPWSIIHQGPSEKKRQAVLVWPIRFKSRQEGDFIIYVDTKKGEYVGYTFLGYMRD